MTSRSRPIKMLKPFQTNVSSWTQLRTPLMYTNAAIWYTREHARGHLYIEADPNTYYESVPATYFPAGVPTAIPGGSIQTNPTAPNVQPYV